MNDRLARQLRKEGMRAQQVTLKIRDPSFHTTTRGEMLPRPSDHDDELYAAAKRLFTKAPPRCVRLIGLRLARLSPAVHQDALFDDRQEDRQAMLCQALDQIQGKYGEGSIHRVALVGRGAEPGKKAKLGRDQNRLSRLEQGD
jgi:DNA polymerase-4